MRIVTRPDFDGIVCAVLLHRALNMTPDAIQDIFWVEPNEIQAGKAEVLEGDILANLPFSPDCSLWFDHHISNKPEEEFKGAFAIAPSAAGVVYNHFKEKGMLGNEYDELVFHTDMIDSADLNQEQVRHPEDYPYILLSMTIRNQDYQDIPYWNKLVGLLLEKDIDHVLKDSEVSERCDQVVAENQAFEAHLLAHTTIRHNISITDFRSLDIVPGGNRFLTYSLFPQSIASLKIRYDSPKREHIQISIGHSIFNRQCHVNIGKLLARFGGGGHAGAGGCTLKARIADQAIEKILDTLCRNHKE